MSLNNFYFKDSNFFSLWTFLLCSALSVWSPVQGKPTCPASSCVLVQITVNLNHILADVNKLKWLLSAVLCCPSLTVWQLSVSYFKTGRSLKREDCQAGSDCVKRLLSVQRFVYNGHDGGDSPSSLRACQVYESRVFVRGEKEQSYKTQRPVSRN